MSSFVHLNVHSHYSAMEGVSSVESLCDAARRRGFDSLALTDTNGLYSMLRFQEIAKENALKPIIGAELRTKDHRAVLLVKTKEGYSNLCRILSARHESTEFDFAGTVARFRGGLILISDNQDLVKAWKRDSSEDLYVEITPGVNMERSYALSRSEGMPPVGTNGVYFANSDEYWLYPILRAISLNTSVSRVPVSGRVHPGHWLVPEHVIRDRFSHLPEALDNSRRIAEACQFDVGVKQNIFPTFNGLSDGEAFTKLSDKIAAGAVWRYGKLNRQIRSRIAHELKIIKEKGYAHYFLVVQEITAKARITCGRGSGAGSIISYCLGITHVDPLRHDLLFERFLSPERNDPPDIDIDFPWDERQNLLRAVFAHYGRERVAMVANHNHLNMAGAIREVAKVYGIPSPEITRVAWRILKQRELAYLSENPASRAWIASLCQSISLAEPWPEILHVAMKIEGHFRHLSVHCGGLVIVPDEIRKYAPVEIAASGVPVLQWEKEQMEEAGLIKIDLLGNRSLSVIRDTLTAINKDGHKMADYASWDPVQDLATKELIRNGETIGCFNIESPALRLLLRKLWRRMPSERKNGLGLFDCLVMVSSLVRPAAISFVPEFIRRAHSGNFEPPHEALRQILQHSHGILLYQEDVTRVAIALAGFSAAEGDQLRKALNKRRKAKQLKQYRDDFYHGALQRGAPVRTIDGVWRMVVSFAGYSFCKAHSASYAQVSFKCAYLKAHHPAEFIAAVLSNEGGYYPALAYISEARRLGLQIRTPDINQSAWRYQGSHRTIRVGFMQIKGIKKSLIDQLIIERNAGGPFSSLRDFLSRTNPELGQARLLIKAGCFDNMAGGLSRPGMLWQAYAHTNGADPGNLSNPPEYSKAQKLEHEIECFGFVLSCHPIDLYPMHLIKEKIIKASELENYTGRRIQILGWLITEKITQTRKGDPMEFVTFEDRSAIYEATFFPDVYRRLWHLLTPNCLFLLDGIVEEDFGVPTLTVNGLKRLELTHKSCYAVASGNIEETQEVRSRFSSAGTDSKSFA